MDSADSSITGFDYGSFDSFDSFDSLLNSDFADSMLATDISPDVSNAFVSGSDVLGSTYSDFLSSSGVSTKDPGAVLAAALDYSKSLNAGLSSGSKAGSDMTDFQVALLKLNEPKENIFGGTSVSNGDLITLGGLALTYISQLQQDRQDEAQQEKENQYTEEQLQQSADALALQAAELDMKYNPGAGVTRGAPTVFGKKA